MDVQRNIKSYIWQYSKKKRHRDWTSLIPKLFPQIWGGGGEPGNICGKSCWLTVPCSSGTNLIAEQNHMNAWPCFHSAKNCELENELIVIIRILHMIQFNVRNFNFRNLSNYIREFNLLILLIALSTCILTDGMCLPSCTSFAGSHCRPSIKGGLFNSTPTSSMSTICHSQDTSLVLYTIQKSRYTCKFKVWYRPHVQWGYKGDAAIWGTSNQKLGRVVVLATAPCGRFQVEVCWSRYVDLTADNDGIHARIMFLKAGGKVPTICWRVGIHVYFLQLVYRKNIQVWSIMRQQLNKHQNEILHL